MQYVLFVKAQLAGVLKSYKTLLPEVKEYVMEPGVNKYCRAL